MKLYQYPYSPGIRSIHRLSDGEHDLTVKAGTPVYTYASQAYGDIDVIAVYVGTNGNTRTTEYFIQPFRSAKDNFSG